jgi:hypothetical protein
MNTRLLFAVFLTAGCALAVQRPDTLWTRSIGLDLNAECEAMAIKADGGLFIAGRGRINDQQPYRALVFDLDPTGEILWSRWCGFRPYSIGSGVIACRDSGCVITGTQSWSDEPVSGFITRIDKMSDTLWQRRFPSTGGTYGKALCAQFDTLFVTVGSYFPDGYSIPDLYLQATRMNGDTLWTQRYGGTELDEGAAICGTANGEFLVAGTTRSWGEGKKDVLMLRANRYGGLVWMTTAGGREDEEASDAIQTSDGGFAVCGFTRSTGAGDDDAFLIKLSAQGDLEWNRFYGGRHADRAARIRQCADGGYILAGQTESFGLGAADAWLVRTGSNGDTLWTGTYGGSQSDEFTAVEVMRDQGILALGSSHSFGGSGIYAVRIMSSCGITGLVRNAQTGAPLAGMRVGVTTSAANTFTNADGFYMLPLTPGRYTVVVSGPCFELDTLAGVIASPDSVPHLYFDLYPPGISSSRSSLNLVVQNHQRAVSSLYLRNSGAGALTFQGIPRPRHPRGKWLTLSPYAGTIPPGDSLRVTVGIDADTLDDRVYDYYGQVDFHSNSCPDSILTIAVNALVLDAEPDFSVVPARFELEAAPNPFNPSTVLQVTVPVPTDATLSIYNLLGRRMEVLAHGPLPAGRHRFVWDAANCASGIYFARFESSRQTMLHKLTLIR